MKRHGNASGFTLIELLVVLTIAAILMAVAAPALQNLVTSSQVTALTDDFVATLNLARSEATRIGGPVTVAPNGSNWGGGTGWSVASGAQTLHNGGPVPAGYSLRSTDTVQNGVTFDSTGRLVGAAGKFVFCQGNGPPGGTASLVTVAASGRVRIAQKNSQGWPLNDDGDPLNDCNLGD